MADNQNIPNQSAGTSMHDELEARFHWLRQEFLPKQGPKILAILVILVAAAIFVVQYQSKAKANQLTLNEDLGKAFNYLYEGKSDSASAALETFLSKPGSSDLQQAKAALLLGNIQFQHGNLDAAEQSFTRSKAKAGDVLLIKSGAEHGLATLAMEKKDYSKAAELLEAFVKSYGVRTGNLKDRYSKKEPTDEITTVPDALWKLTLVYSELQKPDQAKATANKLLTVYGTSRQAAQARKFLATL